MKPENRKPKPVFKAALGVFVVTFSFFYVVGFVPDYVDGTANGRSIEDRIAGYGFENYRAVALSGLPKLGPLDESEGPVFEPERILVNGAEIDLPVLNPESTEVAVLDEALKEGAVRYPLSARLGEEGNIFIFGHSSGLPVVRNQMYKAFNDLPDLEAGDIITLIGGGKRYKYRVEDVRLTDANEELVNLTSHGGKRLTLSTCNSFGQKSERWVVDAVFVGESVDT